MTRDSPASLHASASSTTALMAWDGSGAAMMPSVRANVVAASKTATWWSHLLGWWKRTFRWDVVDGGDRVHHDGEVGQGHQLVDFPLPVALVLQVPFEIEILRGQDRWHERSSRHDLDGDPVRSRQLLERLALGQAHQILAGEGFVELERGMAMESSAVVVACANGNVEKNELLEQHGHVAGQHRVSELGPRASKNVLVDTERFEKVRDIERTGDLFHFVVDRPHLRRCLGIFNKRFDVS